MTANDMAEMRTQKSAGQETGIWPCELRNEAMATTHRWLFGDGCCQFFAFLQQVFGVSQVAAVTMMAAERFLVARRFCCGK